MMDKLTIVLKYLDIFGTKFSFYTNQKPSFYTTTGGILSTLSVLGSLLTFIFFSLDDLNRNTPISTTSSFYEGYKTIKFGKEKIWIPWRIADYNNNKFINHTGLLFPIIYYYSGYKDKITGHFNLTSKALSYKLCNETSMANNSNIYHFSVPLNEIYCLDMEDLDMGGSWIGDFINYVEFDLYFCEDGINYNDTNSKCISFEDITNYIGKNNSLEIDIYFPIIQYQPTNKTHPLIILYRQYFYHLSKYSYKIERIFLQKNILTDDLGWILNKESNYSYWGLNTIKEDSYFNGIEKDIMNEGSNSRAYSLNIYLKPDTVHHKRYYKKLHFIMSDFFPIAYIIFIIMKSISKIFKKAESNQKSIELLFERLKEPRIQTRLSLKRFKTNNVNNFNIIINNRKNDNSNKDSNFFKELKNINQNNNNNIMNSSSYVINNNTQNSNNNNIISTLNRGNNDIPLLYRKFSINNSFLQNNSQLIRKNKAKNKMIIRQKLFPYKYYFYSVFIKNLNIAGKSFFFSNKFSKIYIFLSQLFDITTYLSLHREFNVLKKMLKDIKIEQIEKHKKININSPRFLQRINSCIDKKQFHILAE